MPTNTYDNILTKGPESALPSIEDGKLRFTIDTGRMFVDGNNTRTEVTDFIKGMTENEIKSLLAPIASKIYIASDTGKFMTYDATNDQWNDIAIVDTNSGQVVTDITRNGFDFIVTRLNGSTFSFTQQQYTGNNGIALSGTTFSNSGVRSISEGTTAGTINVNTNGSTANVAVKDAGKGVKSITRSGTTFTATALDGSTFSFTQQDNDTTYTGANGISLSGTTFSNSGVRSIATGGSNGTININTNGSTANIAVKGLGSAAYTDSNAYAPASHSHSYLPLSGGTLTGDLTFANGGTALRGITATIADSDGWRVVGGQTATNSGYLEIATADDYNEPIYVRQYKYGENSNPFGSIQREAILLDANGNTSFPGTVTASSFSGSIVNATGLTKSQVTTALGYTPPTTNTTYSANNGVGLSGTTFYNSGVRSIAQGSANGTISVNTNGTAADVAVKGLGSAAYNNSGAFRWTNGAGIWSCSGNGQNYYYRIATIIIGGSYVNGPILFHLGGRGYQQTNLIIRFQSANNTDPGLDFIQSDIYQGYYIRKTATSTWEVIGRYNEVWGKADLYYIENYSVSITVNMENIGQTLPDGCAQASPIFAFPSDISALQSNFQAGVNSVYNAVVARGVTPASKSLSDVVTGINNIPSVYKSSLELIKTQNGSSEVNQGYCYNDTFSQNLTFPYPIKLNAGKYLLLLGARFDWSTTLTDQSSVTNGSFYVQSYTQPTSTTRFNAKFEYIITMSSAGTFSINIKSSDADQSRAKAMLMKIS